jgi:RecB family exonuclease
MKSRTLKEVSIIRDFTNPVIDYATQKSISYSQTLAYNTCPHQWALKYVKGLQVYKPSIHTVFGTALHEVLQEWLTVLYEDTVKKSNEMDLDALLLEKMQTIYSSEKEKYGEHFSSSEQLSEFHNDGIEIIKYVKQKRTAFFSTKYVKLVGVEIPLIHSIGKNIFFKGFIDIVLYDEQDDKYIIIDIKTSTSGWNDYAKKDDKKLAQLLLYKEFLAKQFNIDVDKVDVKYFIVKRKVPADPDYPAMGRRIQEFVPPSGKIKRGQATTALATFIQDAFDNEGKYIDKQYEQKPSKSNCMFCDFKGTEHCTVGFLK